MPTVVGRTQSTDPTLAGLVAEFDISPMRIVKARFRATEEGLVWNEAEAQPDGLELLTVTAGTYVQEVYVNERTALSATPTPDEAHLLLFFGEAGDALPAEESGQTIEIDLLSAAASGPGPWQRRTASGGDAALIVKLGVVGTNISVTAGEWEAVAFLVEPELVRP